MSDDRHTNNKRARDRMDAMWIDGDTDRHRKRVSEERQRTYDADRKRSDVRTTDAVNSTCDNTNERRLQT